MAVDIYFESGAKKTFACAVDWPGWSRAGRDEDTAVQALLSYAPRYARAVQGLDFSIPAEGDLRVVERLPGTPTTDFGAPEGIPAVDRVDGFGPLAAPAAAHQLAVMRACWDEYERVYLAAQGVALALGPRGGGRDLRGITLHVLGGAGGYLGKIGGKLKVDENAPDLLAEWRRAGQVLAAAVEAAAQNHIPERGPRGGKNWPLRYFVRRFAWHVLDHAWEIEDRSIQPVSGR